MFILEIKIKGVFKIYFLCVFWYGFYNFRKKVDLLEEFKFLLVFIKEIGEYYDLLFLIGGDFNL